MTVADAPDLLPAALSHHRAGRLSQAEALYRQVLAAAPEHPHALYLLGMLALQTSRPALAAACIEQALAHGPAAPEHHYNLGLALAAQGQAASAAEAFQKALDLNPDFAEAHNNLGNALKALGRAEDAVRHYRRALELNPSSASAHNNLGVMLDAGGDTPAALEHYRQAAAIDPNDADTHYNFGNALARLERLEEAAAHYRQCVALRPDFTDAYVRLGAALASLERPQEAIAQYRVAIGIDPGHAQAHYGLGVALGESGSFTDALSALQQAVTIKPDFADGHHLIGLLWEHQGSFKAAEAAYRRALDCRPDFVTALIDLGNVLELQGKVVEAEQALRRALELDPASAAAHNNLGNVLKSRGQLGAAEQAYRAALRLEPHHTRAYNNLIGIKTYCSLDDADVQQIRALMDVQGLSEDDVMQLHFALGKVMHDCGRYDEAFTHYREGNRIKHKTSRFKAAEFAALVDRIIKTFNGEFFSSRTGYGSSSELPVFVVGMARSGTTLVEQIIASHAQADGAGELEELHTLTRELGARLNRRDSYPEVTAALDRQHALLFAQQYETVLRQRAKAGSVRVVDKLTVNFLHLGLMALLFPNAHVVHCRRDPLDSCLSIYFQHFRTGNDYAYDLADIGSFYRQYERLMAHWRRVAPIAILELQYEELVSEPERKIRELMDFLELPWDERCLAFDRNTRPVVTASNTQVRRPMYRSAVRRWRNYEKHLGPLKQALGLD